MASFFRRAGAEIARIIKRAADPGAELDRVLLYSKDSAAVAQLFAQVSSGTIYQLTPFGGGLGASMLYGDGSDGNVTIAAGTTTLARDMFYDTLTIQTGGILNPDGYRIFAKTAIVMQGTGKISRKGVNGIDGLANSGGGGGSALSTVGRPLPGSSAGAAGRRLTAGDNAGNVATTAPGNTQTGGAGGTATTAGGTGGTSTPITAASGTQSLAPWSIQARASGFNSWLGPPGGGGGGGSGGGVDQATGGGGGSGGGYVVVCAPTITAAGSIESLGGNGGACATPTIGPGGGGGGGVGGDLICVCGDGNFPTLNANGGSGGVGKNGGAAGGNGGNGTIRRFSGF